MTDEIDGAELRKLWEEANLLPFPDRFSAMLRRLDTARNFESGERWGTYNIQRLYLEVLEQLGLREDSIPGEPGRAELVMYQLGKFSQVIWLFGL